MSRNRFLLAIFILLGAAIAFVWWTNHRNQPQSSESRLEKNQAASTPESQAKQRMPDEYPQISLKDQTRDAAINAYLRNIERDSFYQWKIPIRFYGKVINQFNNPVVRASVHLQWINRQGANGVGESDILTDNKGLFSLEGVKGKCLIVRIAKNGYYDISEKENQIGFEYANPAESWFYEPDSNKPVVFHLRKKGETESLIVKNLQLRLSGEGTTGVVDLLTGKESPSDGQLQITVWKPMITVEQMNTGKVFPYDWRVQVKINDGGLKEHKDVFPFEAPESGYVAEYDESLHAINGASPGVSVDKEFYFYFGEPRKYGRMHFRTDGHRPLIFIDYWLNPSGSRNLEFDPAKVIKTK